MLSALIVAPFSSCAGDLLAIAGGLFHEVLNLYRTVCATHSETPHVPQKRVDGTPFDARSGLEESGFGRLLTFRGNNRLLRSLMGKKMVSYPAQ